MDPLKLTVCNLMLDVDDYLSYIEDYGKLNTNYFNFVLNKQGIMLIFLHKHSILKSSVITKFIDDTFIALKNKFLNEKSQLKKAGLIFLMSKVFFTDDVATTRKLRVNGEEWQVFKSFLDTVSSEDIRLMMFHLFTEKFFRFTIKSKKLALDFGQPESGRENENEVIDARQSRTFWKDISDELIRLEHTDIAELKQLAEMRDEALKPFDDLLPEKVSIDDAIENFMIIKQCVNNANTESLKKTSRKEIIQSCKDYINQPNSSALKSILLGVSDLSESDCSKPYTTTTKQKIVRTRKKPNQPKVIKEDENDSEDSENELGKLNQKILGTFSTCSEKLKKAYD